MRRSTSVVLHFRIVVRFWGVFFPFQSTLHFMGVNWCRFTIYKNQDGLLCIIQIQFGIEFSNCWSSRSAPKQKTNNNDNNNKIMLVQLTRYIFPRENHPICFAKTELTVYENSFKWKSQTRCFFFILFNLIQFHQLNSIYNELLH